MSEPRLDFLKDYLQACQDKCASCVEQIDHNFAINGITANLRLHHLRVDTNGQAKIQELAEILAEHVIEYALSMKAREGALKPHQMAHLFRKARELFTKRDDSGEAGEMLLYLLLEAVLEAPQVVAKMDLKTNRKVEIHGSDGIHAKWSVSDSCLDIYYLESKLERDLTSAMRNAFKSITSFHVNNGVAFENNLVTNHFKHLDETERTAILHYLDRKKPGRDARINHACLVGFNNSDYGKVSDKGSDALREFRLLYADQAELIAKTAQRNFDKFTLKQLRFEMFIFPFPNVSDFRKRFVSSLNS